MMVTIACRKRVKMSRMAGMLPNSTTSRISSDLRNSPTTGRGQQRGVQVGNTVYSELPKIMLTIVVEDTKLEAAVNAIQSGAKTGQHGDGKIFISPVDAVYTVRTGQKMQDAG
jgi:nitrogen regulatory protein PII 1